MISKYKINIFNSFSYYFIFFNFSKVIKNLLLYLVFIFIVIKNL